jgi:repressor LexA
MKIGDLIREKRLQKRLTLEEVGEKCGVGKSTVRKWETGQIENMGRNKIAALSEALDIPIAVLLQDDIPEDGANYHINSFDLPKTHKLPVYGSVAAGEGDFADNHIVDYEEAPAKYKRGDYFYLTVDGDSMEPLLHNGDYALCKRTPTVDSGTIAIVAIDGDVGVVKKVIYDETTVTLISYNSEKYPPRSFKDREKLRLRILGEVIESKTKLRKG